MSWARVEPAPRVVTGVAPAARVWLAGPVLAATVVTFLIALVPASGTAVQVRWNDQSVDSAQRAMLERRLQLLNPSYLGGTKWGYILGDPSPQNVALLANTPGALDVDFIERDPPRAVGASIVRMLGPYAVQSLVCLAVAVLLLAGSFAPVRAWRQAYFFSAGAMFAAAWMWCLLPVQASHEVGVWMGDYNTYTEDRGHFEGYFGYEAVRFHLHLGGFVLNLVDRVLGSTTASPHMAFIAASWLMGALFLAGLTAVAVSAGWTSKAMRYAALAAAAPQTLTFFGYREVGYFALDVSVFPLLAGALATRDGAAITNRLRGVGVVQGLRSALHGFGLVGLGGALLAAAVPRGTFGSRFDRVAAVATWGLTAYLGWVLIYVIVLGLDVIPGHAAGITLRPLVTPYVSQDGAVTPMLSAVGIRDMAFECVMVGLPVLALGLIVGRKSDESRIAAAFSCVSVLFLLLFWPAQGIGMDADSVFAIFPAFFAGAWLCASSVRATFAALGLLAAAHAVFWYVIRNSEFLA